MGEAQPVPDSLSRAAPATDNPYRNLASAVLHQACQDLSEEGGLDEWLDSEDCKFWCEVLELEHDIFVQKARDIYEVT